LEEPPYEDRRPPPNRYQQAQERWEHLSPLIEADIERERAMRAMEMAAEFQYLNI
jgi:hypothetical protein